MALITAEALLTMVWLLSKETNFTVYRWARKIHKKRWEKLIDFAEDMECDELYEEKFGLEPSGRDYWSWVVHYRRRQYIYGCLALVCLIIGCCLDTPY